MDRTARLTMGVLMLAVLFTPLGVARGQSNNSYARMLDTTRTMQRNFFDDMNWANAQRARAEKSVRGNQPAARPQRPVTHLPLAMTDFTPLDAGHPVLEQFVATLPLAAGPRATLRQTLGQVWGALEARTRPNNLSASLGVAVAAATEVLTGKDGGDEALPGQIARINDLVGASPSWLNLPPRARQQLSDSFMLTATVMLVYSALGDSDPNSKQASQMIARELLARVGAPAPPP